MIKANFLERNKSLCGFCVSGHAEYAEHGDDIVCAGVSSAVQMAANAITEIIGEKAEVLCEENLISLKLPINQNNGQACLIIIKALHLQLSLLSESYKGNIKVFISEVE